MSNPWEIAIVSGKGGTGKTSVAAAFCDLCGEGVYCDCDVDASNLELILQGKEIERHDFIAGSKAFVDPAKCSRCGLCVDICRFDAVTDPGIIEETSCEGCGLCSLACPESAIRMMPVVSGQWFVSMTQQGPLVHARLEPGEENSGKLVALVKQQAKKIAISSGSGIIITDGPPGIGCAVIASLSGADLALVVTEPTLSGIHDLERIVDVCDKLGTPIAVCINKSDISETNTRRIEEKCRAEGLALLGSIPYDENVPKAMVNGHPVTRLDCPASDRIRELWSIVRQSTRRTPNSQAPSIPRK